MVPEITSATAIADCIAARLPEPNSVNSFLNTIPAPIYVTDPQGFVTFFNRACFPFAGRDPVVGKDRWCVTWKLFTETGHALPHEDCPMAVAIRGRHELRGVIAWAERPDGTRVRFMPFPTPIFSKEGEFLGAVNVLIDITEPEQATELRFLARQCRTIAMKQTGVVAATLSRLAAQYELKALAMELMGPVVGSS